MILINAKHIGERFYIKATVTLIDIETSETIITSKLAREEETKKGMDASQLNLHSSMVIVKQFNFNIIAFFIFYLHSSMVIVKPKNLFIKKGSTLYLHSSMVIVKHKHLRISKIRYIDLHSSMVIVKHIGAVTISTPSTIYIPVWL